MNEFKRSFRFFVISVGILYLALATLGTIGFITNRHRANEGAQSHAFLCADKKVIRERISDSLEFLQSGRHINGVSNADIIRGIQRDRQVLHVMDHLKCDQ